MGISTSRLLRHMAWANQKVFSAVQSLPEEALESFITNEDWTVKRILQHLLSSTDWYLYCLQGGELQKFEIPTDISEVKDLSITLAAFDAQLMKLGELQEEMLTINFEGQTEKNLRSTIISQAIYHAVEHRAQLVGALEFRGYNPIILDDIDLWAFENFEGEVEKNA